MLFPFMLNLHQLCKTAIDIVHNKNQSVIFREMVVVYCDIHAKHKYIVCDKLLQSVVHAVQLGFKILMPNSRFQVLLFFFGGRDGTSGFYDIVYLWFRFVIVYHVLTI
jgi:hypothetical protein